ncbi:aminotransferase class III-fold pyridoxal phosphate-dependent enzyme [Shouchella patagoniensis]|uniref:aminotransferase class III-fold pyridoxal phosphate-dependent enzyme n=1 Tax=Shouchella patagoniensis TaxID=228576 RepID=UPI000994E071|nr:aminotransferase class III-fold pyridoxal phosphate-dependent enzyme [Shouchella patagoniensis]
MKNINPSIHGLMQIFHMDKAYIKGSRNRLYDKFSNEYIDFTSQYGALPLGYNSEELWQDIMMFKENQYPSLCQPSAPFFAQELAIQLTNIFPADLNICTFAQSGAEATEAAIKLARAKTKKEKIVSCQRSFHGKTLGALSVTGQKSYQEPFFIHQECYPKIPYNDLESLAEILKERGDEIAAFIVEPVQGEGGVHIPDEHYLSEAIDLCNIYGVLVIIDEIQTGLGRLGNWAVTVEENLLPDIVLLSKALGGGLVPISACISRESIWTDRFGLNHSSTFANNNFTSYVSLSFINSIKKQSDFFENVINLGNELRNKLNGIKEKWPGVIKEVRGRGLLSAIEFESIDASDSFEMANLISFGGYGYMISGYLLNVHYLRVAPFLNDPLTLRVQPPLNMNYADIDYFCEAFDLLCEIIYKKDFYLLYRYTVGDCRKPIKVRDYRNRNAPILSSMLDEKSQLVGSFAFLCHYPSTTDLIKNTPSFEQFTEAELKGILTWEADFSGAGVICKMPAIKGADGNYVEGWLIGITYGGEEILHRPKEEVLGAIKEGVKLAKELGADVIGLGAYTSIVTRGGFDLLDESVTLTTGNTLTIINATEAMLKGAQMLDHRISESNVGIIGANGAIGRIGSYLLAKKTSRLTLIGKKSNNPTVNHNRLKKLANGIYLDCLVVNQKNIGIRKRVLDVLNIARLTEQFQEEINRLDGMVNLAKINKKAVPNVIDSIESIFHGLNEQIPIGYSVHLEEEISEMDVILTATSSMSEFIPVDLIKTGTVICDVSQPPNVGKHVEKRRKDVLIIEGGLVQYADPIRFGQNLGYEAGQNLACLSETILLSLDQAVKSYGIGGRIRMEDVYYIQKLAEKHQFQLADLQSFGKKVTNDDVLNIRAEVLLRQAEVSRLASEKEVVDE